MARQPLNTRLPGTGISFGPGFLAERPKAASLIAECIATWSEIELQTGRLIASLLGVPYQPVTSFFFSLANQREKRKTLDPIAQFVFTEKKHHELYTTIMRARQSSENERIEFSHSLFGIASDDPEGVIVIGTIDRIKHMFDIDVLQNEKMEAIRSNRYDHPSQEQIVERFQKIREVTSHYKIEDITGILEDMKQLHRVISIFIGFASLVLAKKKDAAEESYQTLCREPLVRRFLSQTPPNQGNASSRHE